MDGESRGEINKGHVPSHWRKFFEIMLNLEIENILFLSIVSIVQFILVSDCVTLDNQFKLKISVKPRVWRFLEETSQSIVLRGF
jgi:hypothetical protein